jgi:hypothetical protein
MFVGHYGPSFLAKRLEPGIPLWILFLAVQLLDVCWAIFIFLGVERVRIVPGFTETNALDLYYMPYTHSLPGALAWAAAAAVLYRLITGSGRAGVLVGAAVFSHWPLDLLVHPPDLALYDNAAKVGLGLWNYPYVTLVLEGTLLLGAMALYLERSRPLPGRARHSMPAFGVAILLMQSGMLFGPPPPSDRAMATLALISYAVLAGSIAWLEGGRAADEGTDDAV